MHEQCDSSHDLAVNGCTQPPAAKRKDLTVNAGAGCSAGASIGDGSTSADGNPVALGQTPAGPYSLGDTDVTLTVTDNVIGAAASRQATAAEVDGVPPTPDQLRAPN